MTNSKPAALMSYVHSDDKYQQLTTLRERLSDEVATQIGIEFPIFQDTKDIQWGQNWEQRIESALVEEITFLIPIITPRFFNSEPCRDELSRFLEVEKKLKRNDLILPIYFVDTPLLNNAESRSSDELAVVIASRQYADWRELRFEPFTNPLVGKTLAQLAVQIRDALPIMQTTKRLPVQTPAQPAAATTSEGQQPTERQIAKTEPPTCVVDPMHRGDFTTISAAIRTVEPGTRILVRKGLYKEGLIIDKPLEIMGEGEAKDIVIQATGINVISFQTTMGRVANLTLRQIGGGKFCVDIVQGRLELEDCDINSTSLSGVGIRGDADPRLRRNQIHDNEQAGVKIYERGQGTLEDNDIFGNTLSGVAIGDSANTTLRRNRIHGNQAGVLVHDGGKGTLEENDVFGHVLSGTVVRNAKAIFRRNRIHDNKQTGIFINDGGQGSVEDNDIFNNSFSGVEIKATLNTILSNNRINKNSRYAIRVYESGAGTFENNDLTENIQGPWLIAEDSTTNVKRINNKE